MAYLLSILVLHLVLATEIDPLTDSVEQLNRALSSELSNYQENFVLSFQGINPAQTLLSDNSYQRYMTFSSKYNIKINVTSVRLNQFHSIVVTNFSVDKQNTVKAFYEFGLRPSTIFILLIDCFYAGPNCLDPFIPGYVFNCPAIKILVFPRSHTKSKALMGALSSLGYFQYKVVPITNIITKDLLKNPLKFHRAKYWNGNLKKIPVVTFTSFFEYFLKYRHNTYACSEMVLNPKFDDAVMCTFDIMTTIYFSQVHNLSLNMFMDNGNFIIKTDQRQIIGPSKNYIDSHNFKSYIRTGFALSSRQSNKFVYCLKTSILNRSKFDYKVWTEPFSLNVWILFIFSFIFLPCMIFKNGIGNKFEGVLALLSWQSVSPKNGKIVVVLSFNLMFLSTFYLNEITSLIVVPETPKLIQNMGELLDAGYKLLVNSDIELRGKMSAFKNDFVRFNMTEKLNSSFHVGKNSLNFTVLPSYLADTNTKYAAIIDEHMESFYIYRFSQLVSERLGDWTVKCHIVPEGVNPASMFRVFYTANRYWLQVTLQRIKDA